LPQVFLLLDLQLDLQWLSIPPHQAEKLKQSSAAGNPALVKQEATWS